MLVIVCPFCGKMFIYTMDFVKSIVLDCADEAVLEWYKWLDPDTDDDDYENANDDTDTDTEQSGSEINWEEIRAQAKEDEHLYCESFAKLSMESPPNFTVDQCFWKVEMSQDLKRVFAQFFDRHVVADGEFAQPMTLRRRRGYDCHDTNTFFKQSHMTGMVFIYLGNTIEKYYYTTTTKVETACCTARRGEGHSIKRMMTRPVFTPFHLFYSIVVSLDEAEIEKAPLVKFEQVKRW